ncbi:MAG TPA: large-conductance mechanosensitive channel protein MscL [Bacteroidia bacterium]|nr:large-conductance mechanosensitive channel protein MscL [Bacteroidia bacterium]
MATKKTGFKFINEFKEFAMRGNLIDLAVGVVIGGAFGKLTSSFISDIVMPPIGKLMGNVDFSQRQIVLQKGIEEIKDPSGKVIHEKVAEVAIKYGAFLNTLFDFIIVAFVMFLVIKGMNRMKRKQAEAPKPPVEPSKEELLLAEIRDILKEQRK